MALYAWARYGGNFQEGLTEALNCGGDTDTLSAIVGALMGAQARSNGIPGEWLGGICDWPRSVGLLIRIARDLATQRTVGGSHGAVRYFWPGLLIRNVVFLVTVLAHGVRRLGPPY